MWPFYAALAVGACVVSWRNFELRPVGIALTASCLCSNLATVYLGIKDRPAAYTVCEALVLSMAFLAHVCGASRLMVGVVAVCILGVCFNITVTTVDNLTRAQIITWQIATNLCFGAECILVIVTALYEHVRTRFGAGNGRARDPLHGGAAYQTEAER